MDSQKSGQNCNSPPLSSTSTSMGCGCPTDITVNISPTTGGNWFIRVDPQTSIDNFKKIVSKKLKVHKERICLLYRDKQLREGTLLENGLVDGSRLTLLPSVETGLLTQRPELSVMQALESLNDNQVNDFLSGKAPLNLTMRLGDHMMLIQLQLSTVTAGSVSSNSSTSVTNASTTNFEHPSSPIRSNRASRTSSANPSQVTSTNSSSRETNRQVLLSSLASALAMAKETKTTTTTTTPSSPTPTPMEVSSTSSPIQSLSDLASRPTVPVPTAARIPQSRPTASTATPTSDPIAAGLTSCLCRSLAPPCSCTSNTPSPSSTNHPTSSPPPVSPPSTIDPPYLVPTPPISSPPRLDTQALARASRNLTQTLRQLSSEVLTAREIEQRAQGAIIESMQHHGRGVYSGTFSGTLNPALQDSRGRPRRDISTIVHILNDLLCAAPPMRRAETSSPVPTSNIPTPGSSMIPNSQPTSTPLVSKLNNCECVRCTNGHCASSSSSSTASLASEPALVVTNLSNNSSIIPTTIPLPATTESGTPTSLLTASTTTTSTQSSLVHHHDVNVDEQNSRTRDKIEQLRLVMGQRRERRRLRKQKIQPYSIPTATEPTNNDVVSA